MNMPINANLWWSIFMVQISIHYTMFHKNFNKLIHKELLLIKWWAYFQPAGDSGMNKRSGGNVGIGCGSNGNRTNGASNFQRPIVATANDVKEQPQSAPNHNHNYNMNHMLHSQNQQHQVSHKCHSVMSIDLKWKIQIHWNYLKNELMHLNDLYENLWRRCLSLVPEKIFP